MVKPQWTFPGNRGSIPNCSKYLIVRGSLGRRDAKVEPRVLPEFVWGVSVGSGVYLQELR